jgi:hypothetical protein
VPVKLAETIAIAIKKQVFSDEAKPPARKKRKMEECYA